jgi:hypothetical protein
VLACHVIIRWGNWSSRQLTCRTTLRQLLMSPPHNVRACGAHNATRSVGTQCHAVSGHCVTQRRAVSGHWVTDRHGLGNHGCGSGRRMGACLVPSEVGRVGSKDEEQRERGHQDGEGQRGQAEGANVDVEEAERPRMRHAGKVGVCAASERTPDHRHRESKAATMVCCSVGIRIHESSERHG